MTFKLLESISSYINLKNKNYLFVLCRGVDKEIKLINNMKGDLRTRMNLIKFFSSWH